MTHCAVGERPSRSIPLATMSSASETDGPKRSSMPVQPINGPIGKSEEPSFREQQPVINRRAANKRGRCEFISSHSVGYVELRTGCRRPRPSAKDPSVFCHTSG